MWTRFRNLFEKICERGKSRTRLLRIFGALVVECAALEQCELRAMKRKLVHLAMVQLDRRDDALWCCERVTFGAQTMICGEVLIISEPV